MTHIGTHDRRIFGATASGINLPIKLTASGAIVISGVTSGGAGSSTFLGLTDTPADYSGEGGKAAVVNGAEDALEFIRIVREVENLRMRCDCSDALKEVEVRVREETARKIKNIINNEPIGNSKFVYIGNIINKINREFLVKTEVQKE